MYIKNGIFQKKIKKNYYFFKKKIPLKLGGPCAIAQLAHRDNRPCIYSPLHKNINLVAFQLVTFTRNSSFTGGHITSGVSLPVIIPLLPADFVFCQ